MSDYDEWQEENEKEREKGVEDILKDGISTDTYACETTFGIWWMKYVQTDN